MGSSVVAKELEGRWPSPPLNIRHNSRGSTLDLEVMRAGDGGRNEQTMQSGLRKPEREHRRLGPATGCESKVGNRRSATFNDGHRRRYVRSLSPDGAKVAFVSSRSGNRKSGTKTCGLARKLKLRSAPPAKGNPTLSASGLKMAYIVMKRTGVQYTQYP